MFSYWFEEKLEEAFFSVIKEVYRLNDETLELERKRTLALLQLRSSVDDILILHTAKARLIGVFPRTGKVATFGFWEGQNDLEAHRALFQRLEQEAKNRQFEEIRGPVNFNTYHEYRIRLRTPKAWPSFPGEPHNPDYYSDLLAELGFESVLHFNSHYISPEEVKKVYAKQELYLASLKEIPFDMIPLDSRFWKENLPQLFSLIRSIFSRNPNYTDISFEEFCLDYGQEFGDMLCPHTSVLFVEKSSGKWAAISMCLPNYHELEDVFGPYSYEKHYPHLKRRTFLAKTIGVHPDFRNQHLMRYLAAYGMMRFPDLYEEAIFCLMREDNISNSFTARHQKEVAEYALFRKLLSIGS